MFSHEEVQSLNALEMAVYNYIIKNREKVISMKIRELAAGAHVSTTTVLHMCKKFGCDGYTQFKLQLRQELMRGRKDIADLDIGGIQEFLARLSGPALQNQVGRAVQILRGAGHILFVGVGTSSILARYGARYLCNVGYFATFLDDLYTPVNACMTTQARFDSVAVIALSVSGETQQVLDICRQLKDRGCALISLTNRPGCTLARISDLNISYNMEELQVTGGWQLTCQAPVVCLLEMIGRRLYQVGPDQPSQA